LLYITVYACESAKKEGIASWPKHARLASTPKAWRVELRM